MSTKRIAGLSIGLSVVAFAFLTWLIYLKPPIPATDLVWVSFLPTLNAIFNTCSAICIVIGVRAIKRHDKKSHALSMISAFVFSAFFLLSYVVYHSFQGDTVFTGTGWVRPLYFFILISHIVLTAVVLPLIFGTMGMAITKRFDTHRKLARWTYPLWLYVSVTGVLIYIMLNSVG